MLPDQVDVQHPAHDLRHLIGRAHILVDIGKGALRDRPTLPAR